MFFCKHTMNYIGNSFNTAYIYKTLSLAIQKPVVQQLRKFKVNLVICRIIQRIFCIMRQGRKVNHGINIYFAGNKLLPQELLGCPCFFANK